MNFAMAAGTNATAVWAIAFSMPLFCMMPVNHAGASRMEAMSNAARACASDPLPLHVDVAIVDEQGEAGSTMKTIAGASLSPSATMVPITTSVSATLIQKF
jgi:hypothetical protein